MVARRKKGVTLWGRFSREYPGSNDTMKGFALRAGTTASSLTAAAFALFLPSVVRGFTFADLAVVNADAQTAIGQLGDITFSLLSTRPVTRPLGGGAGVIDGVTDGTSGRFNSSYFTPALSLGDEVLLGGASDFRLTFASPVTDLTVHVAQLSDNRLSFTSDGVPIAFTLLSSDGAFTVFAGNTAIEGSPPSPGNDANGSLLFRGTYTELSWTAASPVFGDTLDDGYWLQFSVAAVPEPACWTLLCAAIPILRILKRRVTR
jgi:hypothetical protein